MLHYQPKCDLDGAVFGVEALVRWQHPTRGLLPPLDFIPVAERTGLVHPLTDQVLDLALAQVRAWQDVGATVPVAVNVSTRSLLRPGFAEGVLATLGTHGVAAELLGLEITETTIMEDPERALQVLTRLAEAGVRLSIDDFGTGYSSLAALKQLPVDTLKIDKSFVMGMEESQDDEAIVEATSRLGQNLGLTVVAEGVESADVAKKLAGFGCHQGQGYFFSKPVEAETLRRWVLAYRDMFPSGASMSSGSSVSG